MVGPRAIPYRTLPSAAAGGSSKNPSSTVILNACRVANELWFKKKKKKANTNLKTWIKPKRAQVHIGWVLGGWWRCCRPGKSIQQMVYNTDDWQFRVSSQFSCCSSPVRANQRKGGKVGHCDGHAGSDAAGWVCSDKPSSFFVVFQVQRSPRSSILGRRSLGCDGQSLWFYRKEEQTGIWGLPVLCLTPPGSLSDCPCSLSRQTCSLPYSGLHKYRWPDTPISSLKAGSLLAESHGATWSLCMTNLYLHLPELGTCKSIFTSKSCTLNKSSERSLADLEFKSLSFPWPCNGKRKTNYKGINATGLQEAATTNGKNCCLSSSDLPIKTFLISSLRGRTGESPKRFHFWA